VKWRDSRAVMVAACLAGALTLAAQQPANNSPQNPLGQNQQKPAQPSSNPGSSTPGGNPFPGDTDSVPVLPNAKTVGQPEIPAGDASGRVALPAQDSDPARSPDEGGSAAPALPGNESSSTIPDLDRIQPKDSDDARHKDKSAPEYHETAGNDVDVGNFELERKNWKAALSRFQSAMILDPENPDIFWGMAEAARHLGDFALARGYYQKVVDYDPDSHHGKEARKALKDPQIANAQSSANNQPKK
jgi:tetratricopeptide (TPR) repeat protein